MKVIKEGNIRTLKKVKTFYCKICGCIFEADNSEYKIGSQYNESYYYIKCPFCNNFVYKDEGEG